MIVSAKELFDTGGFTYEHQYDRYIDFFKMLAFLPEDVAVDYAPASWHPFLMWLGHSIGQPPCNEAYVHDGFVDLDWTSAYIQCQDPRRVVEIASTVHPELVHGLYLADTAWPKRVRNRQRTSFAVTCNGSFFRQEILDYLSALDKYKPELDRAVLVPCAATKPYPAPLHRAVLDRLSEDWDLIITTGVLGLVPAELWRIMPLYDSGLPNLFRVEEVVRWFFTKHSYSAVVVYSDFYAHAVHRGMPEEVDTDYIFGHHYRDTYSNLLLGEHLRELSRSVSAFDRLLEE